MLVKFVTIKYSSQTQKKYDLSEIYINPEHIILATEDHSYDELSLQNKLPEGFPKDQKFTCIILNKDKMGHRITVLGDLKSIAIKLNGVKNGT